MVRELFVCVCVWGGGQDGRPETHRGESGRGLIRDNSGRKGEKHYNKYNVFRAACMVEDAACISFKCIKCWYGGKCREK